MKTFYTFLFGSILAFNGTFAADLGFEDEIAAGDRQYLTYDADGSITIQEQEEENIVPMEEDADMLGELEDDLFNFDFDFGSIDTGELTFDDIEIQTENSPLSLDPVEEAVQSEPIVQEVEAPKVEIVEQPVTVVQEETPIVLERENPNHYVDVKEVASVQSLQVSDVPLAVKLYEEVPELKAASAFSVSLSQVFAGSPVIYTLLILMSICTFSVWFYNLFAIRQTTIVPDALVSSLREKVKDGRYAEALSLCNEKNTLFSKMLASGISSKEHGLQSVLETMKSEGKRVSVKYWQRLTLLNDIAIIAPMLGLLGTVLGMFYAFYDLNRSKESMKALFDGLGISVGTTVAGLGVAILAMIIHSISKYRLVRVLAHVENEANQFAAIMTKKSGCDQ